MNETIVSDERIEASKKQLENYLGLIKDANLSLQDHAAGVAYGINETLYNLGLISDGTHHNVAAKISEVLNR